MKIEACISTNGEAAPDLILMNYFAVLRCASKNSRSALSAFS